MGGFLDESFHIPTRHEGTDDIRLSLMVAEIEDADDIGMVAQLAHRLGFPLIPIIRGISIGAIVWTRQGLNLEVILLNLRIEIPIDSLSMEAK